MIDTKLILIEGVPGSGKTTTAMRLASEIRSHGRECRWFHEWQEDHPIFIGYERDIAEIISSSRSRAGSVLRQWKEFAERAQREETINIIESRFWQTGAMFMYGAGCSEDEVMESNRQITEALVELSPVLIYFTHDDLRKAITRTMQIKNEQWQKAGRGEAAWERFFTSVIEQQDMAADRGLKGREAWFVFFSEWVRVAEKLYSEFPFPKTKIHDPHSDWDLAMQKMRNFLGLL